MVRTLHKKEDVMKKFNDFSKKVQIRLNKTSFWIAEKFLLIGFVFFFLGINELIKHPEIDVARTSEFFPYMVMMSAVGILLNFFGIRNKEKYFLATKKFEIKRHKIVDKILLLAIIIPSISGYIISCEMLFMYFILCGVAFMLESLFVDSIPQVPKER